jgi:2-phosphosulfolactate phosphatase
LKDQFTIECDSARIASALYQQATAFPTLLDFLKDSSHYRRLSGFGLVKDMEYCTTPNLHPVVPIYNGKELEVEGIMGTL